METVDLQQLVLSVAADLMRKLHEVIKYKKPNLLEYCSKTRSLLKRIKKIVTWARTYPTLMKKEQELNQWIDERKGIQKTIAKLFSELKHQQMNNLRTAPFAIAEAGDVLCRHEYCGFPVLGIGETKNKSRIEVLNRIIKHKSLLLDLPLNAEIKIGGGILKVKREEFYFKFTLTPQQDWELLKPNYLRKYWYTPEVNWKFLKPFRMRNQELSPIQMESIYQEISDSIKKCEGSQILIVTDSILKKKGLVSLLNFFYTQGKNMTKFSSKLIDKLSLQVNYWPEYPSYILLRIDESDISITHHPKHFYIHFSTDLSEIVNEAIQKHKKIRLENFGKYDEDKQRVVLNINGDDSVEIDIRYFTGDFIVYLKGKYNKYLSEKLNLKKEEEFDREIENILITEKVKSICRTLGKELVQEPLRFCRCLYVMSESHKRAGVIGYIDLGSVLPTDPMGNLIVFALRIYKDPMRSELVGFNETKEEYTVEILKCLDSSLEMFINNSISQAKDRMLLMRIPISLLARPEF